MKRFKLYVPESIVDLSSFSMDEADSENAAVAHQENIPAGSPRTGRCLMQSNLPSNPLREIENMEQDVEEGQGWLRSDAPIIPDRSSVTKRNKSQTPMGTPYTPAEIGKLINYVLKERYLYMDAVYLWFWMEAERLEVCPNRTAQSMMEKFKKTVTELHRHPVQQKIAQEMQSFFRSSAAAQRSARNRMKRSGPTDTNTRLKYSRKEDLALLDWVRRQKNQRGIFWTDAENEKICPGRNANSLYIRYNKIKDSFCDLRRMREPLSDDDDDDSHPRPEPSSECQGPKKRRIADENDDDFSFIDDDDDDSDHRARPSKPPAAAQGRSTPHKRRYQCIYDSSSSDDDAVRTKRLEDELSVDDEVVEDIVQSMKVNKPPESGKQDGGQIVVDLADDADTPPGLDILLPSRGVPDGRKDGGDRVQGSRRMESEDMFIVDAAEQLRGTPDLEDHCSSQSFLGSVRGSSGVKGEEQRRIQDLCGKRGSSENLSPVVLLERCDTISESSDRTVSGLQSSGGVGIRKLSPRSMGAKFSLMPRSANKMSPTSCSQSHEQLPPKDAELPPPVQSHVNPAQKSPVRRTRLRDQSPEEELPVQKLQSSSCTRSPRTPVKKLTVVRSPDSPVNLSKSARKSSEERLLRKTTSPSSNQEPRPSISCHRSPGTSPKKSTGQRTPETPLNLTRSPSGERLLRKSTSPSSIQEPRPSTSCNRSPGTSQKKSAGQGTPETPLNLTRSPSGERLLRKTTSPSSNQEPRPSTSRHRSPGTSPKKSTGQRTPETPRALTRLQRKRSEEWLVRRTRSRSTISQASQSPEKSPPTKRRTRAHENVTSPFRTPDRRKKPEVAPVSPPPPLPTALPLLRPAATSETPKKNYPTEDVAGAQFFVAETSPHRQPERCITPITPPTPVPRTVPLQPAAGASEASPNRQFQDPVDDVAFTEEVFYSADCQMPEGTQRTVQASAGDVTGNKPPVESKNVISTAVQTSPEASTSGIAENPKELEERVVCAIKALEVMEQLICATTDEDSDSAAGTSCDSLAETDSDLDIQNETNLRILDALRKLCASFRKKKE